MSSNGIDVNGSGITTPNVCETSKFFAIEFNGLTIDIGLINFSNRLFIIITEFGKIGSLYSVRQITLPSEDNSAVYDIRTLFGEERTEYDLTARALADITPQDKPILLGIALKDVTYALVETLKRIVADNKIW